MHTYYAMRTVTWRKLMRSWVWTGCGKGVKACRARMKCWLCPVIDYTSTKHVEVMDRTCHSPSLFKPDTSYTAAYSTSICPFSALQQEMTKSRSGPATISVAIGKRLTRNGVNCLLLMALSCTATGNDQVAERACNHCSQTPLLQTSSRLAPPAAAIHSIQQEMTNFFSFPFRVM